MEDKEEETNNDPFNGDHIKDENDENCCDIYDNTDTECFNQILTSSTTEYEEELRTSDDSLRDRFDVLSMINNLLDEDSTDNIQNAQQSAPATAKLLNCAQSTISTASSVVSSPITNGYYNTIQRLDDIQSDLNFRNYKPPSQVKVQINCNGQQTVTSASLQDFRRLIGLKDSPRKHHNQAFRRPVRGYDGRNSTVEGEFLPPQHRNQVDCATRFAFRFGKSVCDELKDCLINLRRITDIRSQAERLMASRSWMARNVEQWNLSPPSESCCMIDWLVFEFLKEYCNTNSFLKGFDHGCSSVTITESLTLMKEWLDQIRLIDGHRRAGFCDCSFQRPTVPSEKALRLLRSLNDITNRVGRFVSNLMQLVRPSFPSTGVFQGTIN